MINVRRATVLDAYNLELMCKEYWDSHNHLSHSLTYDKETCISSLISIMLDDSNLILIAEDDETFIGFMWVTVARPFYSNDLYLNEQYLYVRESHRNTKAFAKLLTMARALSKELGCNFLQVGDIAEGALSKAASKRFNKIGELFIIER